jgi:DNA adenine methylase
MGSASLFFSLCPSRALLSDLNQELVETFTTVRDHPRAVYNRLTAIPVGKESYNELRAKSSTGMNARDRAARFIFLNRFCFNGIYRTNMAGNFNVPFSSTKTGQLPDWGNFYAAAKALRNADIRCADFETIVTEETERGDFVYLDPPYAVSNRRIFRQYGPQVFGTNDLERLADALTVIDKKGIHFVVTYAMSQEALQAFRGWHVKRVFTQRNVSGFAKHRRRAVELIITNA